MLKKRLIACLLWRDGLLLQTVNFKHINFVSSAFVAVDFFNTWAIDEIIILDISPDSRKRKRYYETIKEISKRCFVPLTVGGKIKAIDEIRDFLRIGADKITINSQAVREPEFIAKSAQTFGNQCIVVSIDVRKENNKYQVYIDNGKTNSGLLLFDWAKKAEEMGAGEIFLTSIDRDGKRNGYDLELIKKTVDLVSIPVIASGGVGHWQHFIEGIKLAGAEAVSAANIFHYSEQSTKKAKNYLKEAGINIREPEFYKIITPRRPEYRINY